MHPNTYLRTYWRAEFRPQVFVATGPDDASEKRFVQVIQPAIEQDIDWGGTRLRTHRVELAQFGESVLTEIADAATHSVLVVADVSTAPTGERSGNVMFAVGLALACRQAAEVLLVREDQDRLLFEASTVPSLRLEFSRASAARARLAERLRGCLRETELVNDARLHAAVAGMTGEERQLVARWGRARADKLYWLAEENPYSMAALSRLLDKELVRTAGVTHDGHAMFVWTRLGRAAAENIDRLLPIATSPPSPPEPEPAPGVKPDDGGPKWI